MNPPPIKDRDPRAAYAAFLRGDTGTRRSSSPVIAAGGGRIELCLSLPPVAAGKNNRSWKARSRVTRQMRDEACQAVLIARVQGSIFRPWWGAEVVVQFYVESFRRDASNLLESCKAYCDGIQDSGLFRTDKYVLPRLAGDPVKGEPRSVVELLERIKI
jgi:hypothetical protein